MQSGKKDVVQRGTAVEKPRQGVPRLHEELRFSRRSDPGVLPLVQHAATGVGHGAGRGQPVALAEVDVAAGRQQVPKIVVAPARPGKTVVDVRGGSDSRRRPHAGQRKSTIAQLLRPLKRQAGVVAAFGPLECIVCCRSTFGHAIPGRNHVVGRYSEPG